METDNIKVTTDESSGELLVTLPPLEPKAEEPETEPEAETEEAVNLVSFLNEKQQTSVAERVWEDFGRDVASRRKRMEKLKEWIELAAMRAKEKSWPWQNCANVTTPMLVSAAIQIHARLFDMMFPADGPIYQVKPASLMADEVDRATRTELVFNDVVRNEIEDYEIGYDDSLWQLVLCGSTFRRVVFNDFESRIDANWIGVQDFVVPYKTHISSPVLKGVPRYTWVQYKTMDELHEAQHAGYYENVEEIESGTGDDASLEGEVSKSVAEIDGVEQSEPEKDGTESRQILEQHCRLTLPKLKGKKKHPAFDGKRHYVIVTIDEQSRKILRLTLREEPEPRDLARYQRDVADAELMGEDMEKVRKPRMREVHHFIHLKAFPSEGFYGLGLGDLLGGLNKANNTMLNQFIDALTARNAGGGFISSNIRGPRGSLSFQPGQFIPVNAPGSAIKEGIVHMNMPDPNPGVVKLVEYNDQSANRTAANADLMSGEGGGDRETATSMKIRTEMMMKQISVLMRRIKKYQEAEGKLLWRLCALFLDEDRARLLTDQNGEPKEVVASREDFVPDGKVVPSADTTISSRTQRVQQALALHELLMKTPTTGQNPAFIHASLAGVFTAYGDYEKRRLLGPAPTPPKPEPEGMEQYEENARMAMGLPVEVREADNHDRHLLQMEQFQQEPPWAMLQANQQFMAGWAKHTQDHLTFQYLVKQRGIDADVNGGAAEQQPMVGAPYDPGAPGVAELQGDAAPPEADEGGPGAMDGGGGGDGDEAGA